MKRIFGFMFITLLLTGCATVGTINWTDEGAYCFDSMDTFWKFDKAIEGFDIYTVQQIVEDGVTVLLPQGVNVKVLAAGSIAVSPAKVEALDGAHDGVVCYTYQGAVEE